jgi:hypothetical protein
MSSREHLTQREPGATSAPDHPDLAAALAGRIAVVALIVVTQLWALTTALDAWFERDMAAVWWLLGYQVVAFATSLLIWIARPERSRFFRPERSKIADR